MAFCENCGSCVEKDAKFCNNCGYPIENHIVVDEIQNSEEYFADEEEIDKKKYAGIIIVILMLVILGIVVGWIFFGNNKKEKTVVEDSTTKIEEIESEMPSESEISIKDEIAITADKNEGIETEETENVSEQEDSVINYENVSMDHVSSVTATSSLSEYGMTHVPESVTDGDLSTGWVEAASGQGIGESITICFDDYYKVNGFKIYAGFQASADLYAKNSRPRRIQVSYVDGSSEEFELSDLNGEQEISLNKTILTNKVTFTILSVYEGYKYEDTVISEITVY